MRRKFKKRWAWIVGLALITLVLAATIDLFIAFILQTQQKVEITKGLIESLTTVTKTATSLVVALAALIAYRVMRKK